MSLTLQAHAKINLTLEVLGKRDDGYHNIATVFQTISLSNTLSFEPNQTIELHCTDTSLEFPDNLVLKAAQLLKEETACSKGVSIHLRKSIPTAAGLGSGSTDAATTLIGLNQLWELNLAPEKLSELAAKLGSDVAFFLQGGTAAAKGRGEILTPLPPAYEAWGIIATPLDEPISNKTAKLYSQLNQSHYTQGQFTETLVNSVNTGQQIDDKLLYNVFAQVAFDFFPKLADYRSQLIEAGAKNIHIAGSGPTLFTLVADKTQGEAIVENLKSSNLEIHLVHTI